MDIKISRIRKHDTGVLKAHFTVELDGIWYRDCSYFNTGSNDWMNFPQEMKPPLDGSSKMRYVPYCGFVDNATGNDKKRQIINELKKEMANESATPAVQPASEIQDDPFALPF